MDEKIKKNNPFFKGILQFYRKARSLGIPMKDTREILEENYSFLEKVFFNEPLNAMNALNSLEEKGVDLTTDAPKKVSNKILELKFVNYRLFNYNLESPFDYYF